MTVRKVPQLLLVAYKISIDGRGVNKASTLPEATRASADLVEHTQQPTASYFEAPYSSGIQGSLQHFPLFSPSGSHMLLL